MGFTLFCKPNYQSMNVRVRFKIPAHLRSAVPKAQSAWNSTVLQSDEQFEATSDVDHMLRVTASDGGHYSAHRPQ